MNKTFLLILLACSKLAMSQPKTPKEYGLKQFQITDSKLGNINFYVTRHKIGETKPLLLLLDGSGHFPLHSLIKKNDGSSEIIGTIPFNFSEWRDRFHVVVISKPGVPFLDSLEVNNYEEFVENYKPSEEYNQRLSLDWRVNSASLVINHLTTLLKISDENVFVIGYSEGGQVVPKLALVNKKITKIASIVGGGLNQFYDFIIEQRLNAEKGIISAAEAGNNVEKLYLKIEEIYQNPGATDLFWKGHTYQRWASFCNDIPLNNLAKLNIPILLVVGGRDTNSPILGLDYVKLEFLRLQKKNLTYKVYPNCDHQFNDQKTETNRLDEVMDFVVEWVGK